MPVFILGAARTAIGRYGGTLRQTHPAELGARAAKAALDRAGVAPGDLDEAFFGHGRQAGSGPNSARQACQRAGVPFTVPAQTINQACASGLQSVALGAQAILLGQSRLVLAGGMESMPLDQAPIRDAPVTVQFHPRGHLGIAELGSGDLGAAPRMAVKHLFRIPAFARTGTAQHQSERGERGDQSG